MHRTTQNLRMRSATLAGNILLFVLCALFLCHPFPASANGAGSDFADAYLEHHASIPGHLTALSSAPEMQLTLAGRGMRSLQHEPCILWAAEPREPLHHTAAFSLLRRQPQLRLKLPSCRGLIVFSLPPPMLSA